MGHNRHIVRPDYDMIAPENGEKILQSQEDSAPGKNGGFPFTILKPRAEGYETEIVTNFAFRGPINRVMFMRKPQALNALTVWVFASDETRARRLTTAKLHGTSPRGEQSSTEAVAEVQMDNRKR